MAPLCKGSCQRKLTEGLSNSYSETKEPRNVLGWALGGSSFIMCCVEGANPRAGLNSCSSLYSYPNRLPAC